MLLRLLIAATFLNFIHCCSDPSTLKLVQIVWRHGDRNPTDPYPGDVYNKTFWDGRGGYGELTTAGMEMHVKLGTQLRARYIDQCNGFLRDSYNPAEIYVRSTDVNRTIISAISNLIGMYGQGNGSTPGIQYPVFKDPSLKWPSNFVPIAVHTVDDNTDHLGNANAFCPRQDALWALAMKSSKEVQAIQNSAAAKNVQKVLMDNIGVFYKVDEFWKVHDVLFIEKYNGLQLPAWATDDFINDITSVNDQLEDLQDGIGLSSINNINFGVELPKLRAGALTNDMAMHMNLKVACAGQTTGNCTWINGLKYYAYSAHDETIASFLATLGAKSAVVPHGYPIYSAAAIVELHVGPAGNPFFRIFYHNGNGTGFDLVTGNVAGCNGTSSCPLDVFNQRAQLYNPGDADKYCANTNVDPQKHDDKDKKRASNNFGLLPFMLAIVSVYLWRFQF